MPEPAVFPLMLIRSAGLPFNLLIHPSTDWKTMEAALRVGQEALLSSAQHVRQQFDQVLKVLPESALRTAVYNARKAFYQKGKLPPIATSEDWSKQGSSEHFAELLNSLEQYSEALEQIKSAEHKYSTYYHNQLEYAYRSAQTIAREKPFQQALLYASHSLLKQLPRFAEKPVAAFDKKDRQTAIGIWQYATRMATKTSPLSYFTSVSVLRRKQSAPELREQVTPNVALLEMLYALLLQAPEFYRTLSVGLNPFVRKQDAAPYQWLSYPGGEETVQEAELDPVLDHLVDILGDLDQGMPFLSLVSDLEAIVEAPRRRLESYLLGLLEQGFLEWKLPVPGLNRRWCIDLMRYLQTSGLSSPVLQSVETLLQDLDKSCQVLVSDCTVFEKIKVQRKAADRLQAFANASEVHLPPIASEQLFYSDVTGSDITGELAVPIDQFAQQLKEAWQQRSKTVVSGQRAALLLFAQEYLKEGESIDVLTFAKAFLKAQKDLDQPFTLPNIQHPVKIGAVLQPFQNPNGDWQAVVNGLYPGGGKLFARWLDHKSDQQELKTWLTQEPQVIPFPWHGYFNANFQPDGYPQIVQFSGGRMRTGSKGRIRRVGNLHVQLREGIPVLVDQSDNTPIVWADLGLEAVETKPPIIQALWYLGTPYISLNALLPQDRWAPLVDGIQYQKRHVSGQLVLAREAWSVEEEVWKRWLQETSDAIHFFRHIRTTLAALTVPQYFFARFPGLKPQFFDQANPVLMELFHKTLQKGSGGLLLTEMLPSPDQTGFDRAVECVVEFMG